MGRNFPLSIEKLSPILAYYVADSLEAGSRLCDEILHYGGMGHTASVHTRNREAALRYGLLMPAARVVVNTPSTHGAIGFSTAFAPSMTLGCGSWGGNVTSDNISPLHLMDIIRVAFETRPVTADSSTPSSVTAATIAAPASQLSAALAPNSPPAVDQAAITELVDKFFAARKPIESVPAPAPPPESKPVPPPQAKNSGPKAVDFVCEDDVKRAIAKGEKIYVHTKTIITPSARDLGQSSEIFAKGN